MDNQEKIDQLKEEILGHKVLSELDLQTLYKKYKGKVHCDQYHEHSYKCILHETSESAVIERLIEEIRTQRKAMRRIQQEVNTFINPELEEY